MPSARHAPAPSLVRRGPRALIRMPQFEDERAFLAAGRESRKLHGAWVRAPSTPSSFRLYVRRFSTDPLQDLAATRHLGFLVCERGTGALVGVMNLSEIIHGALQSAFLGYYGFAPLTGRGLMREGLGLTLDLAFGTLRLHRIEANVQPRNARSIALVEACGFTREGYSRRYVKIAGRWRDHVRFAMLAEDWRALRRRRSS